MKRSTYIQIDRHRLSYLSWRQKFYCMYCGYANGAVAYWREIVAQTEKYWCGIQHQKRMGFKPPEHHARMKFAEYDNEADFKAKYQS